MPLHLLQMKKIYIGSDDGFLYMLNASDGKQLWSFPVGGEIRSQAAISDGYVVVGSTQNSIFAFYSKDPQQPNDDNQTDKNGLDMTVVYVLEGIVFVTIFGLIIIAIFELRKKGQK